MAKKTNPAPKVAPAPVVEHPHCADGCGARVNSPKSTFLQGHDQRLISDLSFRVVNGQMGAFQRALLVLVDNPATTAADEFYYNESGDIMDRINTISAAVTHRFSSALSAKFVSAAMAKWDKSVRQSNTEAAKAAHRAAKAAKKANTESPATRAVFRNLQKADGQPGSSETIGASFDMSTRDSFWADAVAYLGDKSNLKEATIKAADRDKVYKYFASGLVTADATPEPITGSPEAQAAASTVGREIQNLRGARVEVKIGRWTYDAVVIGMNRAGKVSAVEYTDKKGNEKTTDKFELIRVISASE